MPKGKKPANDAATKWAEIGLRIRVAREAMDLKAGEAAKLIGVSQHRFSQWETGERRPTPDGAIQICNALKVTTDYIYRGDLFGLPHSLVSRIIERRGSPS